VSNLPGVRSLLWNALLPFVLYRVLHGRLHFSDLAALGWISVLPLIGIAWAYRRHRTVDLIGGLSLAGIVIGVGAVFIGGDPRLVLLRESLLTGVLGVACLVSFATPRPLMYYFARYFAAGPDAQAQAAFDARWVFPRFRRVMYVITAVWGAVYALEFTVKAVLVYTLPIDAVLVVSPIVSNAATLGAVAWTVSYGTRAKRAAEANK